MSRIGATVLLVRRFKRYRNRTDPYTPIVTRLISKNLITDCNWMYFQSDNPLWLTSVLGLKQHGQQSSNENDLGWKHKGINSIYLYGESVYCYSKEKLLISSERAKLIVSSSLTRAHYMYVIDNITYKLEVDSSNSSFNTVLKTGYKPNTYLIHAYFGTVHLKWEVFSPLTQYIKVNDFIRAVRELSQQLKSKS